MSEAKKPIRIAIGDNLWTRALASSSKSVSRRRADKAWEEGVERERRESGSLLSQALIGGSFDVPFSQGSEAMVAKLRGADQS